MLIIGKEAEKDIREAYDWYERKLKSNLKGTRKKRVTVRSSLNNTLVYLTLEFSYTIMRIVIIRSI